VYGNATGITKTDCYNAAPFAGRFWSAFLISREYAYMSLFGPIDIQRAIQMIVILLIAIDIHELAHAIVADRLGDDTPRRLGEISLNPFTHMDQVGVVLLLITSISNFGFTYGRTHVTPSNLKYGPQRGHALVAVAGPLANLVLAAIGVVVLHFHLSDPTHLNDQMTNFLWLWIQLNVLLFVFNLFPIPPLDGFTIVGGFLTSRQLYQLAPYQQWGPLIILLLFITEPNTHIIGNATQPIFNHILPMVCSYCTL
jgi:Zn-dependent protease